MSFIEFLLEYYIYILAVLIILIVGVIGFLVDSKNKEKKKQKANESGVASTNGDASNTNVAQNSAVLNSDGEPLVQTQVQSVNEGQNVQMGTQQSQILNGIPENGGNTVNADANMGGVIPNMVSTPNVESGIDNGQVVQSVMPAEVPLNNSNMNVDVSNGNSGLNFQAEVSNSSVNLQPVTDVNLNTGLVGGTNVDTGMNNSQIIQPVIPSMEVSQPSVAPVMQNNDMSNNTVLQNVQPSFSELSNANVNPVQPTLQQAQVNTVLNQVPVENVNAGVGMVSNLNGGITNEQSVQQVQNTSVEPVQVSNVIPAMSNVEPSLINQNQMMGEQSAQSPVSMEINNAVVPQPMPVENVNIGVNNNIGQSIQSEMTNGVAQAGQSIPTTNVASQAGNNDGLQNSNVVVTSDGAQPFDISSMFANNQ